MNVFTPTNSCAVAVIGAGPYGLSVASALKAERIDTRTFGSTMSFWRENMPKGMRLRSPWRASHIGVTQGELSLDTFASAHGIPFQEPLPLETFVDYGMWVQSRSVADLDTRHVTQIERSDNGFRLVLDDDEIVHAGRVVVALGLLNQQFIPAAFEGLPSDLVSHTCDHSGFEDFRGRRVAVVGRGQSACESAALLKMSGADVEMICRGDINWLGHLIKSGSENRSLYSRFSKVLESPSAVGPFPLSWLVELPEVVRRMPSGPRGMFSARCLKAGAAGWLRTDFEGIPVNAPRTIVGASARSNGVSVEFDDGAAEFDHVLLATGYSIDVTKLGVLGRGVLDALSRAKGSPVLSTGFESNVPGLHFVGASAVHSYGPLMRFVAGTPYAARHIAAFIRQNDAITPRPVAAPRLAGLANSDVATREVETDIAR